jgi:hypothetical protein
VSSLRFGILLFDKHVNAMMPYVRKDYVVEVVQEPGTGNDE